MGITLSLPTPGASASNGTWGASMNTAFQALSDSVQYAVKSADEGVISSTTLQDDDHLANIPLSVGNWAIEANFMVSGSTGADVKVAWAFSGTASPAYRMGTGPKTDTTSVVSAAAATTVGVNRSAGAGDTSAAITSSTPYGVDGTNWSYIHEAGFLTVSASGTLKVQWAQNASVAASTIMRAGSFVKAQKVSG